MSLCRGLTPCSVEQPKPSVAQRASAEKTPPSQPPAPAGSHLRERWKQLSEEGRGGPQSSSLKLALADGLGLGLFCALSTSQHLEKNKKVNNRRLWARGQGRLPPGTRAVHKLPQLHSHGWDVTGAWLNHSLVLAGAGDWLLLYSIMVLSYIHVVTYISNPFLFTAKLHSTVCIAFLKINIVYN